MTDTENEIRLPEGLTASDAVDVLREFARTDNAQIINQERYETLQTEVKNAKEAFAAVLAEESPQSQDALARQEMNALSEPFENDDGDIEVDTLQQMAQTGDVEPDDDAEEATSTDTLSVTPGTIDEIETLAKKLSAFDARDMDDRVDAIERQIVDVAGADSYEQVTEEVL